MTPDSHSAHMLIKHDLFLICSCVSNKFQPLFILRLKHHKIWQNFTIYYKLQNISDFKRFYDVLLRYLQSDVILVLGNFDMRTCQHACQLWVDGWSEYLMYTSVVDSSKYKISCKLIGLYLIIREGNFEHYHVKAILHFFLISWAANQMLAECWRADKILTECCVSIIGNYQYIGRQSWCQHALFAILCFLDVLD